MLNESAINETESQLVSTEYEKLKRKSGLTENNLKYCDRLLCIDGLLEYKYSVSVQTDLLNSKMLKLLSTKQCQEFFSIEN